MISQHTDSLSHVLDVSEPCPCMHMFKFFLTSTIRPWIRYVSEGAGCPSLDQPQLKPELERSRPVRRPPRNLGVFIHTLGYAYVEVPISIVLSAINEGWALSYRLQSDRYVQSDHHGSYVSRGHGRRGHSRRRSYDESEVVEDRREKKDSHFLRNTEIGRAHV